MKQSQWKDCFYFGDISVPPWKPHSSCQGTWETKWGVMQWNSLVWDWRTSGMTSSASLWKLTLKIKHGFKSGLAFLSLVMLASCICSTVCLLPLLPSGAPVQLVSLVAVTQLQPEHSAGCEWSPAACRACLHSAQSWQHSGLEERCQLVPQHCSPVPGIPPIPLQRCLWSQGIGPRFSSRSFVVSAFFVVSAVLVVEGGGTGGEV